MAYQLYVSNDLWITFERGLDLCVMGTAIFAMVPSLKWYKLTRKDSKNEQVKGD